MTEPSLYVMRWEAFLYMRENRKMQQLKIGTRGKRPHRGKLVSRILMYLY